MVKNFSQFTKSNKKVDTPPEKYPTDDITKPQKPEKVINKANSGNVSMPKSEDITNEAVTSINDNFKVKTMFDVPKSLVKEYIEKVKTEVGKNPLEFWGAEDIAEEMVKHILAEYFKLDNVPAKVVFGDTRTQDEAEVDAEAETSEIEVTETDTDEDFTKDTVEEEVAVEEEEMFGMSEQFTDSDIKFKKSK